MKLEELISKPLHELTDEEIADLVTKLTPSQLSKLERQVKKAVAAVKKPKSQKAKQLEDLFNQALCGAEDARKSDQP